MLEFIFLLLFPIAFNEAPLKCDFVERERALRLRSVATLQLPINFAINIFCSTAYAVLLLHYVFVQKGGVNELPTSSNYIN